MTTRYHIKYSPKSLVELTEIYTYIANDSPQNAARMVDRILAAVEGLTMFPHRNVVLNQPRRSPQPVRSLPVPPFMVFFRVDDGDRVVYILRLRHGARRRLKRY